MKDPKEMTDEELQKEYDEYVIVDFEDGYYETLIKEMKRRGLFPELPEIKDDGDLTWEEYKQKHYEKKQK